MECDRAGRAFRAEAADQYRAPVERHEPFGPDRQRAAVAQRPARFADEDTAPQIERPLHLPHGIGEVHHDPVDPHLQPEHLRHWHARIGGLGKAVQPLMIGDRRLVVGVRHEGGRERALLDRAAHSDRAVG